MSNQRNAPAIGNMPLHNAITENRYEDVLNLLTHSGILLDEQNELGETPLFYSLKLNRSNKLVSTLIDYGCDVNIANKYDETPLHRAAQRRNDLIIYKLIRHGANIHAKDYHGSTPLHRAVAKGRDDNIHVLMYFGSCVDKKNSKRHSPFSMAFNKSQYTFTSSSPCLLNYMIDFNERDSNGFTHLHRSLEHLSYSSLDIINRGADVNLIVDGKHCIHFALLYSYCEVFEAIWCRVNLRLLLKMGYCNEECFLEMFLHHKYFNNEEYLKCLYLIFDSPKINAFVAQYLQNDKLADRAMHIALGIYIPQLQERLSLIYLFLSHGFEIYFEDICLLCDTYTCVDCCLEKTVEVLLNHGSYIRQNESIRNAENYDNISVYLIVSRLCYDNFEIYSKLPDYNLTVYPSEVRRYRTLYKANFEMNDIQKVTNHDNPNRFYVVTEVPSLLQLSRDAFRAALYEKCSTKQSFEVYQTISRLPVPDVIKDILRLKTPIYSLDD